MEKHPLVYKLTIYNFDDECTNEIQCIFRRKKLELEFWTNKRIYIIFKKIPNEKIVYINTYLLIINKLIHASSWRFCFITMSLPPHRSPIASFLSNITHHRILSPLHPITKQRLAFYNKEDISECKSDKKAKRDRDIEHLKVNSVGRVKPGVRQRVISYT